MKQIDLFRVSMSPEAGPRLAELLKYDENGRMYVGEGPVTARFERAFGDAIGIAPHPLAVNSCTAAIDLALRLIGVEPGDEVITTPMTCTATNGPIVNLGARPVWADIDPLTGLIDPQDVAKKITHRTKAIVAVDWGGRLCDYRALNAVSDRIGRPVPVIEDAAHRFTVASHPSERGQYVCWSFGPIKHLTCGGYGGALLTPSYHRTEARLLRWHGLDRESSEDFRCSQTIYAPGFRYHMTDDMATVGLANLEIVQGNLQKAKDHYAWLWGKLLMWTDSPKVQAPVYDGSAEPWFMDVLVDDQAGFMAHMKERGIATSRVHARNDTHPAYLFPNGRLPGVDYFDAHHVALPVHAGLTQADLERISAAVVEWGEK